MKEKKMNMKWFHPVAFILNHLFINILFLHFKLTTFHVNLVWLEIEIHNKN